MTAASTIDVFVRCGERYRPPADDAGWQIVTLPAALASEDLPSLGMPLVLDALLAHHLRQLGTIHFYDQVIPPSDPAYRLAISWS